MFVLFFSYLSTFRRICWPFVPVREEGLHESLVATFTRDNTPQAFTMGLAIMLGNNCFAALHVRFLPTHRLVSPGATTRGDYVTAESAFGRCAEISECVIAEPDLTSVIPIMVVGACAQFWMEERIALVMVKMWDAAAKSMCEALDYKQEAEV